ncbi:hypothetical protein GW7_12695 [Heterocephalus glaber]|uniref:Uncharacterized protein n=1 Tax=Heterocephalus glaber TaxID=10181 RepID=G5C8F5_HETGA|nr:hypothetical protein GW7_12695 [Heterocephalus glaber]
MGRGLALGTGGANTLWPSLQLIRVPAWERDHRICPDLSSRERPRQRPPSEDTRAHQAAHAGAAEPFAVPVIPVRLAGRPPRPWEAGVEGTAPFRAWGLARGGSQKRVERCSARRLFGPCSAHGSVP